MVGNIPKWSTVQVFCTSCEHMVSSSSILRDGDSVLCACEGGGIVIVIGHLYGDVGLCPER